MTAARTIDVVFVHRVSGGDSMTSPPPVGVPVADIAGLPTPTELPRTHRRRRDGRKVMRRQVLSLQAAPTQADALMTPRQTR
jgi:hypothetical protein